MTTILDGKKLRDKIIENLKAKVDTLDEKPTLVVILVGENPASKIYVNNKKKMAEITDSTPLPAAAPSGFSNRYRRR